MPSEAYTPCEATLSANVMNAFRCLIKETVKPMIADLEIHLNIRFDIQGEAATSSPLT